MKFCCFLPQNSFTWFVIIVWPLNCDLRWWRWLVSMPAEFITCLLPGRFDPGPRLLPHPSVGTARPATHHSSRSDSPCDKRLHFSINYRSSNSWQKFGKSCLSCESNVNNTAKSQGFYSIIGQIWTKYWKALLKLQHFKDVMHFFSNGSTQKSVTFSHL